MRCRICGVIRSNETWKRNPMIMTERLCRECAHVCEMNVPSLYTNYYTDSQRRYE